MALNAEAVGTKTEPIVHTYRWQDQALYALGIGATARELDYLYEKRGPRTYPTFAVIPAFEANRALFDVVGGDFGGVVHGGQKIVMHKPFAPAGTLTTVGEVAGIYDLKRLAQSVVRTETRDERGELVAETEWMIMYLLDGGFGGSAPPKTPKHRPPEREADWIVEETTSPEQALLYRLSGDLNPLHADPAVAEQAAKVTNGKPILHGLCTYGYVARAIIHKECGGDATRLRVFEGRFSKPVWPGETLVTEGWREDGRIYVRTATKERPSEHVFTAAYAEVQ
ncbi:MAG: MaoC family dehydratase N-terminal domain-containing protein [Sandaracinaceae bacterium]|nr:MaoC family dehydratase N-terminal domain-containing protein [Sandaracinaceae bacterium]MCC6877679.1 MaoC family dehydratase N-terminal domain-containing protein [Sandaracinaceae bacterium]